MLSEPQARPISLMGFAAALLFFLLPFVTVSCSGETVQRLSGTELVTGTDIENRETSPRPMAILAVVAGVAGLGLGLIRGRRRAIGTAASGLVGAASLLLLQWRLESEAAAQAAREGIRMELSMEPGYWLALLLFFGLAAANGLLAFGDGAGPSEPASDSRSPPAPPE